MEIKSFLNAMLSSCLLLLFVSAAQAEEFPLPLVDYSADMNMDAGSSPDGKPMVMKGKIFASKEKERRVMASGGNESIIITRRDKNVTWILMPDQKMYMESLDSEPEKDPERMVKEGKIKFDKLGREKVNGVSANKYKIQVGDDKGDQFEGHLWLTDENILVRMEGSSPEMGPKGRVRLDYTNIKIEKQNPGLFEIPAGYKRFAMPQMPGIPGMGTMPGGEMTRGGMTE